ncbi:MAG: hypothetical protein C0506_08285 [Anaerolinea sp.]|nr:hypothetical protein [Anaerolinea sp.]
MPLEGVPMPHRLVSALATLGAVSLMGLVLLAALLTAPATSRAQEPPLLTARVTDLAGVLSGTADIEKALQDLEDGRNVQLWVLFVETTGSRTVTQFADAIAEANSFGGNDALVVVAVRDRSDALWVGPLLAGVTNDEIDRMLSGELEPRLSGGDFNGAVSALARALGVAVAGDLSAGSSGGADAATVLLIIGVVFAIAVAGAGAWWAVRWRRGRQAAEERDRQTGQLAQRANPLLLEVDDGLRDAQQELGFAEAQFAEADVAPFRAALDAARTELQAAFRLRQQLDDDRPEEPATRRTMLEELIARAEQANALLARERARLEKLRDLERTAPDVLAGLSAQLDETEARIPQAEASFRGLEAYAPATWEPLKGNVVEARKRLDFAREATAAGLAATAAGDGRAAAARAREGQAAHAQAGALLDAIDRQAQAVQAARETLDREIAAAEADVRAALAAVAEGKVESGSEDLVRAQALLESAKRAASAPGADVLAALRMAQEANSGADTVLAGLRAAEKRQQRAQAAFEATLRRAETAYRQAADYVLGPRPGIGREARTRLAEAERHLAAARELQATDLASAASEAAAGERLANDAIRLAQGEFGGHGRGAGGSGAMGGVLGGIIGGILAGGMRGGPGFGGTAWGSPGQSRSRGGGFRIPSGVGRGGGRSRGGRW